jgi:uncharacterized protein YecT (DUF1311 family)
VAIKVVDRAADDGDAAARIAREARLAKGLRHPHIVLTLAVEEGDTATALVTEYVAGGTLRGALRASADIGEPWSYDRVVRVLRELASALAHAHDRRVVHRDVKPENVFLDGVDGRALLGDFGIARRLAPDALPTLAEGAAGTPCYMAPEQVAGVAEDERADVYALGLVGWELLTGRRPWQGETLYAVLHKQQHEPLPALAPLRPDIPAYLLAAIEGALAKDPAGRWRDGTHFLRQLTPTPAELPPVLNPVDPEADAAGTTVRFAARRPAGGPRPRARWRIAPRQVASVVGVALLVVAAAIVPDFLPQSDPMAERQADRSAAGVGARAAEPRRATATSVTNRRSGDTRRDAGARDAGMRSGAPAAGRAPPESDGPPTRPVLPAPTPAPRAKPAVPVARAVPRAAPRPAPRPAPRMVAGGAPRSPARPTAGEAPAAVALRLRKADARMDAAFTALLAAIRESAGGAREPRAAGALRAEQRRWIARRDDECRTRAAGAGDRAPAKIAACRADMTAGRAQELAARRTRFAP